MKNFRDCIRDHRDPIPGSAHGLANMQVEDAAYESSRTGKALDIQ
jgi:predicted dehydrogenase